MMSSAEDVHWAPIVAVVACGSCLSTLAAGVSGFAAGFVGVYWAKWLPALALPAVLGLWIGGAFGAPRDELRT